jgi:hypothetical protein
VEENFKQAELKRIKEERAKRLADKQREEDLKKIAVSTLYTPASQKTGLWICIDLMRIRIQHFSQLRTRIRIKFRI